MEIDHWNEQRVNRLLAATLRGEIESIRHTLRNPKLSPHPAVDLRSWRAWGSIVVAASDLEPSFFRSNFHRLNNVAKNAGPILLFYHRLNALNLFAKRTSTSVVALFESGARVNQPCKDKVRPPPAGSVPLTREESALCSQYWAVSNLLCDLGGNDSFPVKDGFDFCASHPDRSKDFKDLAQKAIAALQRLD